VCILIASGTVRMMQITVTPEWAGTYRLHCMTVVTGRRLLLRLTPTSEYGSDGVSVDPLEVMFVKVKSYMITSEISFSKKALKYQHWQQQVCVRRS